MNNMRFINKSTCPYCSRENEIAVTVVSPGKYQRVVTCGQTMVKDGCGRYYAIEVLIEARTINTYKMTEVTK